MTSVKNLEAVIADRAKRQARAEWNELESILDNWSRQHPTRHARFQRNDSSHYGPGKTPSCCVDLEGVANGAWKTQQEIMRSFATAWKDDRAHYLVEKYTKELLEKVDMLGGVPVEA